MSMASSLEARVPLLDHPLVEFAARLPPSMKVRGLTGKYLLRRVASEWLPPPILKRSKQGFPIPLAHWLRGEARDFCRELLSREALGARGLFDPIALSRLVDDHESGAVSAGGALWALMSIELWHRLYVDAPVSVGGG